MPREKVLAAVVRLLETTLIRVGNEEYARQNRSFGLTTLRRRHADVRGTQVRFTFRGKSGVSHSVSMRDRRLARVVRQCQQLPGQRLFEYLDDDGCVQVVSSENVNDYLRDAMGDDFTAKDFRTWAGTVLAMRALKAVAGDEPTKAGVKSAVAEVAAELGNTPAVARSGYIHPAVIDAYLDGSMDATLTKGGSKSTAATAQLHADERRTLSLVDR